MTCQSLSFSPVMLHRMGLGLCCHHRFNDGMEQPLAYASRTLTPAELKYAQLPKEALSIIFIVKHFHQYLCGCKFTIVSDHKPLRYILRETKRIPPMASARVQRWALMLSAYIYLICYKPGVDHANADGLRRLPVANHITEVPVPGECTPIVSYTGMYTGQRHANLEMD